MTRITKIRRRAGLVVVALALGLGLGACTDLLVEPESEVTGANVFTDASSYRSFLAKLYAGLAVTGQQGPAGIPDIEGIDEGFSQYVRGYWQLQELPTDEAVIGWGDVGLPELVYAQWAPANQFVTATYYRIFFQIAVANEFLRETSETALAERGHQGIAEIPQYRAEARLLRALSLYHGLDLFRNIPLVTEDYAPGDPAPDQAEPQAVFDFIVSELNEVRDLLPPAGQAEYGRFDQGGLAMILAKLYLNAEAYGLGNHYADAVNELQAVLAGPYTLEPEYQNLFLADNHTANGIIFAIPFDGTRTQTWGGMTFIEHAAVGGSMDAGAYGLSGGWYGLRVPQQAVAQYENGDDGFQEGEPRPDVRSQLFYTAGQDFVVDELGRFEDGYTLPKFRNVTRSGAQGSNADFPDTDFPMFRLADAYLMYAEAVLRGGGGSMAQAVDYVNQVRERAYGGDSGNISEAELDLDFIIQERGRELIWEGHRRQDLVRFGLFTGGEYLWALKGGVPAGTSIQEFRDLFPIPANELLANPNITQNPGYGG